MDKNADMAHILTLDSISKETHQIVGSKAARLSELRRQNIRIPHGFVVTTPAYAQYANLPTLPPQFASSLLNAFDAMGGGLVAVRSSAISEDGATASWAGQFESYLNVPRDFLEQAVINCWESAQSQRVKAYGEAQPGIAVLVQAMVESRVSGVMFTANPVNGASHEVVIESIYGLGELLVQGEITPDHYIVHKQRRNTLIHDIVEKQFMLKRNSDGGQTRVEVPAHLSHKPTLMKPQIDELMTMAAATEAYYGYPLDIEWAYDDKQLYLLQARPITTIRGTT
jgi:phosphoenolpyruvate synthase/pyruvate phosphate dikinase